MTGGDEVIPGDGSELQPLTGFESLWRTQFTAEHDGHDYVLEADVLSSDEDIHLYRDGKQVATASNPATFPLDPETDIEAHIGWIGMRRVALVSPDGNHDLPPLAGTFEHRRAEFHHRHPILTGVLAGVALVVLVLSLLLEFTQSVQWITRKSWFEKISTWTYHAPIDLPLPINVLITLAGIAAAIWWILRLRHSWILEKTPTDG